MHSCIGKYGSSNMCSFISLSSLLQFVNISIVEDSSSINSHEAQVEVETGWLCGQSKLQHYCPSCELNCCYDFKTTKVTCESTHFLHAGGVYHHPILLNGNNL